MTETARIYYTLRNGTCCFRSLPISELADAMERLYRRRIAAKAYRVDPETGAEDRSETIGEVSQDYPDPGWIWWSE